MVQEIDLDKIELEEQTDLRPSTFTPATDRKSTVSDSLVKAGIARDGSDANRIVFFVSVIFFVLSVILFAVASTIYVRSTAQSTGEFADYLNSR